jgi:hypothetical protein
VNDIAAPESDLRWKNRLISRKPYRIALHFRWSEDGGNLEGSRRKIDERATLPIDPVTTEDFMSEAEFIAFY